MVRRMDLNGNYISGDTYLQAIPIPIERMASIIIVTNIDNDQLTAACTALGISPTDVSINNATKQHKLLSVLHSRGITVNNVVELHKPNKRAQFRAAFLAYLSTCARLHTEHQQASPSRNSDALNLLAATHNVQP